VHGLDAGDDLDCRPEGLEPHHRPSSPLDGSVILLDDVVQVLALPKLDVHAAVGDQCSHGGRIGAALVDGDLLGTSCRSIARSKKRRAAATSRWAVKRKSTVWPSLSTARYKYFH
jgi:hypothetical protein